jgi:hypothetical protein
VSSAAAVTTVITVTTVRTVITLRCMRSSAAAVSPGLHTLLLSARPRGVKPELLVCVLIELYCAPRHNVFNTRYSAAAVYIYVSPGMLRCRSHCSGRSGTCTTQSGSLASNQWMGRQRYRATQNAHLSQTSARHQVIVDLAQSGGYALCYSRLTTDVYSRVVHIS